MKQGTKKKKVLNPEKKPKSGFFSFGIILGVFILLIDRLRAAFLRSGLYRILTSGSCLDELPDSLFPPAPADSFFSRLSAGFLRFRMRTSRLISVALESSVLLRWLRKLGARLLNTAMRSWGVLLAAYGIISAASLYLRSTLGFSAGSVPETADLIPAACLLGVCVLLLWCSDKKLLTLVGCCLTSGFLFRTCFDFLPEKFRTSGDRGLPNAVCAAVGGLLGLTALIADPFLPLKAAGAAVLLWLILLQPEIGVVTAAAVFPFTVFSDTPAALLCALTLITAFSFAVKLLTRRRAAKLRKTDAPVFLLMLAFLSGIVFGAPGSALTAAERVAMMLIYFLVVLMMRDRIWLRMCGAALLLPAVLAAFLHVLGAVLSLIPSEAAALTIAQAAIGRFSFSFETTDAFALYLTAVLPFALGCTITGKKRAQTVFGAVSSLLLIAGIMLLRSGSAWIGMLCSCILFILIAAPRALAILPPAAGVVTLAAVGFSDILGTPLVNFFSLPGETISHRGEIWTGTLAMLRDRWLTGCGVGPELFRDVYIGYALYGAESSPHAFSLYLQLTAELGLIGLFLFLVTAATGAVSAFSFLGREERGSEGYLTAAACVGSLTAILTAGLFNYAWNDCRIFFLFWLICGISAAAARHCSGSPASAAEEPETADSASAVL